MVIYHPFSARIDFWPVSPLHLTSPKRIRESTCSKSTSSSARDEKGSPTTSSHLHGALSMLLCTRFRMTCPKAERCVVVDMSRVLKGEGTERKASDNFFIIVVAFFPLSHLERKMASTVITVQVFMTAFAELAHNATTPESVVRLAEGICNITAGTTQAMKDAFAAPAVVAAFAQLTHRATTADSLDWLAKAIYNITAERIRRVLFPD